MADTEPAISAEEVKTEDLKKPEVKEEKEVKKEEAENGKHDSEAAKDSEAPGDSEASQLDEKLKMKVLGQLEYYFGDVSLPRDTFMKGEMAKDDGWIGVATMLKFNRLKTLLDALEEKEQIPAILESLQGSDLIEVDPAGTKLRRNPQMPPPESKAEDKTVYLKNFNRTETTLDELLDHFKANYEGVQAIIMRHFNRKTFENGEVVFKREFKGSIFVVFKTTEQAEALLKEEGTKYKGLELIKMMQKEHSALKLSRFQARVEARKKKEQEENEKGAEPENPIPELPQNIFVKVLAIPEGLSREDIKSSWAEFFGVKKDEFAIAFIDFNRGEKDAVLRLDRENAATEAVETISKSESNPGKVPIGATGGDKTPCEVQKLEGEEEEKHRAQVAVQQKNKFNQRKRQAGRGRGRGRGHKRQRRY